MSGTLMMAGDTTVSLRQSEPVKMNEEAAAFGGLGHEGHT